MPRTFLRQDAQVASSRDSAVGFLDNIAPSEANYETNATDLAYDLNAIRSKLQDLHNRDGDSFPTGDWFAALTKPTALEDGTVRGIDAVNAAIHALEKKRILRDVSHVGTDVTVGGADNFVVLALAELPANTTAAVGAVTTLGTVAAAHGGTFGTHALTEVAGGHALNPANLCEIVDADSGDPILSSGRRVWALFQTESGTDEHTMTGTTPNRAQLSFVRPNATFDDLEACPAGDIQGQDINYTSRERVRFTDLTEHDFLRGAIVDVGSGAGTVDRQTAYTNQGVTPVDLVTNAILDLEGAGLEWQVRDDAQAILFRIIEGSAGSTSKVAVEDDVDEFDVDAVVSDFLNGVKVDTGAAGTTINIGVTANQIDSGGALKVASGGSGDLTLEAANELLFDDANRAGSTFSVPLKAVETQQEWSDLDTEFGEVSLANMLIQASQKAARVKGHATLTANVAANTNITGAGGSPNLDAQLPDYSGVGTFVDDVDVYLNGEFARLGADASANHDFYPGTSAANGDLLCEYPLRGVGSNPDQLAMVVWGS